MKPKPFFTLSNAKLLDPNTGTLSDLPPLSAASILPKDPILPRQADGQVYSAEALSSGIVGSAIFSVSSVDGGLGALLAASPFCALVISHDGVERGKAVIRSRADLVTLLDGGEITVSWYRKVGDDWEFMERRPLTMTRQPPTE